MAGVNKVIIVGRLGNDPESRPTQSGSNVVSFSLATSEKWTDKNTGQPQERTEWHNVTCFNKVGELAAQYLKKGSQVYVEGKLRTEKYTDANGIERTSTKIHADQLSFLGDSTGGGNNTNYQRNAPPQNQGNAFGNQQQPFANQQPQNFGNQQQPFANQQPQNFGQQQPQNFGNQQQPFANQQPQNFGQQQPFANQQPPMPQQMPNQGQAPMQQPQPMLNQGFNNQMPQGQMPKAGAIDDDIPF